MSISKVFRLHQDNEDVDWFPSSQYGQQAISKIEDPNWGNAKRQITSIPSPFARIDLVKTAFQVVNNTDVEGDSIYHKIVSDTLDVGQIFYIRNQLKEKIEIISWNPDEHIRALKNSTNKSHQLMGESLSLFWDSDKDTYNFTDMRNFYILKFRGVVIGGISPSTLFFPTANDVGRHVDIYFDNDRPFDDKYLPLYNRDKDYQEYLFSLSKEIPNFAGLFKELEQYLDKNVRKALEKNSGIYDSLMDIRNGNPPQSPLEQLTTNEAGEVVEVFGTSLKCRLLPDNIQSDFLMNPTRQVDERLPLVLANHFSNPAELNYHGDRKWSAGIQIPYAVKQAPEQRTLPRSEIRYPYLTISDLLEPYLIRLVYPLDKDRFYTGNYWKENDNSFLIPIKPLFFDYFDVDFLTKGTVSDGKKVFEFEKSGTGMKVRLRIPIQRKHYVTFERTYHPPMNGGTTVSNADEANNKGWIIEHPVAFSIFPFIYIDENDYPDIPIHMRVQSIEMARNEIQGNKEIELRYFDADNQEIPFEYRKRSDKSSPQQNASSLYFALYKQLNYFQVQTLKGIGLVIPLFPRYTRGNDKYRFAVDFGTTYTHIEYRKNKNEAAEFTINPEEMQLVSTIDPDFGEGKSFLGQGGGVELWDLILHEMLPPIVNKDSDDSFPLRTTISELYSIDYSLNQKILPLAEMNIPFRFEKDRPLNNAKIITNLKWSNYHTSAEDNHADEKRVKNFIEIIAFLMRNKVLLNNADLNKCTLTWFYPASMLDARRNKLERIWQDTWQLYSGINNPEIESITESIAPFYYYAARGGIQTFTNPALAIDIGGETVDIVVFSKDKPIGISSARFGANAIYGDGYNSKPDLNGFMVAFRKKISDQLERNKLNKIIKVHDYIKEMGKSDDFIAFYFSLESNADLKKSNLDLNFSDMLFNENRLKYIYLLYYFAILFQSAKYFKLGGIRKPGIVIFSGTASKMIDLLDPSIDRKSMNKLINHIFSEVYEEESELEIIQENEPKKVTAKGGVFYNRASSPGAELKFSGDGIKYSDLLNNEETRDAIIKEVLHFIDFFEAADKKVDFHQSFAVERGLLKGIISFLRNKDELAAFYEMGLKRKFDELQGKYDIEIEEPLFFYPLIGMFNKLAYQIANGKIK